MKAHTKKRYKAYLDRGIHANMSERSKEAASSVPATTDRPESYNQRTQAAFNRVGLKRATDTHKISLAYTNTSRIQKRAPPSTKHFFNK